jgi:hypothetical protein
LARFCNCSRYFGSCPKPIRQCCIYEEDEEQPKSSNPEDDDNLEDKNLASLQSRGAWIVEVLLVRAQNLPRLDWAMNDLAFIGRSDPFVKLSVRTRRGASTSTEPWQHSTIRHNTLDPNYSETFRFHLQHDDEFSAQLLLEVLLSARVLEYLEPTSSFPDPFMWIIEHGASLGRSAVSQG